eukprot:5019675-Pyramimonas_sp.AAC.1
MDSTAAEGLVEAWRLREAVSEYVAPFAQKIRHANLDGAKSNPKAENDILRRRGAGWSSLELDCESHIAAKIKRHMYSMVDDDVVKGMIHWGLVMNDNNNRVKAQRALRSLLREKIKIRRGRPPADSRPYMRHVMCLALRGDRHFLAKGLSLIYLPNGDPTKTDDVDVWVPFDAAVDEDYVRKCVTSALTTLLLSSNVPIVDRNRWNQSDAAENRFILMEGLFGLASRILGASRVPVSPSRNDAQPDFLSQVRSKACSETNRGQQLYLER